MTGTQSSEDYTNYKQKLWMFLRLTIRNDTIKSERKTGGNGRERAKHGVSAGHRKNRQPFRRGSAAEGFAADPYGVCAGAGAAAGRGAVPAGGSLPCAHRAGPGAAECRPGDRGGEGADLSDHPPADPSSEQPHCDWSHSAAGLADGGAGVPGLQPAVPGCGAGDPGGLHPGHQGLGAAGPGGLCPVQLHQR